MNRIYLSKSIGCLYFVLLLSGNILSQQELFPYKQIQHITNSDGLSNNNIFCILQDKHGFMWFLTGDGLNRYDGYGFKIFRNVINDSTSLSDNHISVIDEDFNHHDSAVQRLRWIRRLPHARRVSHVR